MRHTPKLLALEPIETTKLTSSKEAIHKFFSMYYNGESFNSNTKFETSSNNNQDYEMPRLKKSLTTANLFKREKSNVSLASSSIKSSKTLTNSNNNMITVSNNVSPNNKVKFHSHC